MLANAGCVDVAVAGETSIDRVRDAGAATVVSAADLLSDQRISAANDAVDPVADAADRDALILFTSGTTGLPKTVAMTSGQLSTRMGRMSLPFHVNTPPSVGMMCVPYFHVGGALGMLGSLYSGNTTVVQKRFDAGEWLRLVSEHRVMGMFLVPTMLQRILDHPDFARTDLSSLRAIAYGAAAAPTTLVQRAMAALPNVALPTYSARPRRSVHTPRCYPKIITIRPGPDRWDNH